MKRTIPMTGAVVAFAAAAAGIALAQQSKQGGEQPLVQHAKPSHDVKKAQPAQNAQKGSPPIDPEAYARYRKAIEPAEASLRTAQDLYRSGDLVGAERAAQETITLAAGLSPLPQELARRLIGRIRMRQGRYKDALEWLGVDWQAGKDARLDLDVALCYARLGNPQMAKRFYSDEAVLRYVRSDQREEYHRSMPGVANPRALEASILFVRGNESAMSGRHEEAVADFKAAGKLAPTNGLIAYGAAMSLVDANRSAEAAPFLRRAAQYGRGKIARDAKWRLTGFPRS